MVVSNNLVISSIPINQIKLWVNFKIGKMIKHYFTCTNLFKTYDNLV